jgi:cytidylate kinase
VAKELAKALGWSFLDTGAMYRAVTALALRNEVDPHDSQAVARLAESCHIETLPRVTINGLDVTAEIRQQPVTDSVSLVASNPHVRANMVTRQREWAQRQPIGTVVEGRDIGSVVFPDATLKVYLTADLAERARRRGEEGAASLERRDNIDSSRATSPLVVGDGARVLDTTNLGIEEVVKEILQWLAEL